jgi:hypothetical protein
MGELKYVLILGVIPRGRAHLMCMDPTIRSGPTAFVLKAADFAANG